MVRVSAALPLAPPPPLPPPQAAREVSAPAARTATPVRIREGRRIVRGSRVRNSFIPVWLLRFVTEGSCRPGTRPRRGPGVGGNDAVGPVVTSGTMPFNGRHL